MDRCRGMIAALNMPTRTTRLGKGLLRIHPLLLVGAIVIGVAPATPAAYAQSSGRLPVTFTKDVAPIIFGHCASCHRPGEIGSFSLLSYRDVRQRATQIGAVTASRVMPPWKPSSPPGEFIDDRSLNDAEIHTIQEWIAQGAREGDPGRLPPVPQPPNDWQLGVPDLIVSMPQAYVLDAAGTDVF